ncbi:hypothetical protein HRK28_04155 [Rathayibacter sp. VKM Ac-2835]|uniref:hypothetical protein n=1 Tax=Rathayibacter sp. VKM Ac-2835 TaxID=2739043 RepID=UPI001564BD8A|nr:hypothetical protein [Rathayibacter sp. VKM Ac-2835]NRG40109.1 hypothetical protein [Rathayibacter sp. VKM Ac-2835]
MTGQRLTALVFLGLTGAYALYSRFFQETATGRSPGVWDVLLDVAADPYYLGFVVVPLWLILSALRATRTASPGALLRHGSLLRAWGGTLAGLATLCAKAAAGALAVCLVCGAGLQPTSFAPPESVAAVFRAHGFAPVAALVAQVGLLGASLCATAAVVVSVRLLSGRASATWASVGGLFLWVVLSVLALVPPSAPLSAAAFLDLVVGMERTSLVGTALRPLIVLLGVGLVVRHAARASSRADRVAVSVLLSVSALLVLFSFLQASAGRDLLEVAGLLVPSPLGSIAESMQYLLVFLPFLLVGMIGRGSPTPQREHHELIRAGSRAARLRREVVRSSVGSFAAWTVAAVLVLAGVLCATREVVAPSPQWIAVAGAVAAGGVCAALYGGVGVVLRCSIAGVQSRFVAVCLVAVAVVLSRSFAPDNPFLLGGLADGGPGGDRVLPRIAVLVASLLALSLLGSVGFLALTARRKVVVWWT